jgi:D-alanyl-D-alanine carboxypeptidase/D-alanyl-D-alanine-endopeptidase (penicillin-binding protein 4)
MTRRPPILLALLLTAFMAGATAPDLGPDPTVQSDVEALLKRVGWARSEWGVLAISLDRGDTLVSINATTPLVPASNVKLLTTAAALHYLNSDFRYRTFLVTESPVVDGVLRGDLVLYGTGDPALSWRFSDSRTATLEALADSLLAQGITRIEGSVVGDASYFTGAGRHADWDPRDRDDWFAAPATALSFNENVVTLRIVSRETSAQPTVLTVPNGALAGVPVINKSTFVSSGPTRPLRMGRPQPESPIVVSGDFRRGSRDQWRLVTVDNPPQYAAAMLERALSDRGITVTGPTRAEFNPNRSLLSGVRDWSASEHPRILATHRSPELLELLKVTNQESHNLYAELILKTLGRVVEGDGSFEGGARAVTRFLVDVVGTGGDGVHLVDGSGLSRTNLVSPAAFVSALSYMSQTDHWDALWASLPEAGGKGRLRRMGRSPAASNLRAKTGTLTNVSALSGQLTTMEGERVAFSILQNGVPSTGRAKALEDRLSIRLASFRRVGEGASVNLRASDASETGSVANN